MLIRPALPQDADAIWSILQPICAAGEVFCMPRDGGRAAAFDYWFSGANRQVFVAEVAAGILGTSYLRPNHGGGGAHVANAGYATAPAARGKGIARALLAPLARHRPRSGLPRHAVQLRGCHQHPRHRPGKPPASRSSAACPAPSSTRAKASSTPW